MHENLVEKHYGIAREMYAEVGVDTESVLRVLPSVPLSIHCWQGDDVGGFETIGEETLGGGLAATGNYPGKARTIDELRSDLVKCMSLLPGNHRLALHMSYGDFDGRKIDRDKMLPGHFDSWIDWGTHHSIKLDMNSTFFSHPNAAGGFTLSSKDKAIRNFWIEHGVRTREISAHIGSRQKSPCIHNLWIPDGMKDLPADRSGFRKLLCDSLNDIFRTDYPPEHMKDTLEGKLFGIGSEAYVVGSHEFYMLYAARRGKMVTLDSGHFHPTESVADKISTLLLFFDEIMVHISRGVRWDSDHVVILNDESMSILREIIRSGRIGNVHLGLDFFDASINRVGAWTVGSRAVLKAVLLALLEPHKSLIEAEAGGDYFSRMQISELLKTMPFGAVWDYYCLTRDVPLERDVLSEIRDYDQTVTRKR